MVAQPPLEERRLVDALRAGDESAFTRLVEEYGPAMLRVARMFVSSRAVAEEVVQEAWVGVLNGIGRFEGRSSLKTWIFRILTNTAKTRAVREGRSVPFSSLAGEDEEGGAVDADRFLGDDTRFPGHWAAPPQRWEAAPEGRLLAAETLEVLEREIAKLPANQAVVVTMRDVEGFDADDVCNALDISETNQRVLLHRARTKLRRALEEYMQ
ncbi:MAG: sigma-70 family RNA polymerase sigma factor [Actinobacteria bacterium]|nr:MAG: sigma-70 family RNA polymerase sigma factor [Actinomycetota bacterium]